MFCRPFGIVVALLIAVPMGSALDASYGPPVDPPTAEMVQPGGFISAFDIAADGTIVWGELEGPVRRLDPGADAPRVIFEPAVTRGPEWGLTGLALAPDFATTGDIFVAYTVAPEGTDVNSIDAKGEMRLVRVHEGEEQRIFSYEATRGHNSGRLLVHDDSLFMTNGDHKAERSAQDPGDLRGKILRMTLAGEPHPDNPHADDPSWHPYAFSMGHRNPYGLAWDEKRGTLVQSEVGNRSHEEINHIVKGGNYGWPDCEGLCQPTRQEYIDPIVVYPQVVTPIGMAVIGDHYYLGTFNDYQLRQAYETPEGWTDRVIYEHDQGILDVHGSPDGKWIYFGSWNGLFRIPTPADDPAGTTAPTSGSPATTSPTASTNPTGSGAIPAPGVIGLVVAAGIAVALVVTQRRR